MIEFKFDNRIKQFMEQEIVFNTDPAIKIDDEIERVAHILTEKLIITTMSIMHGAKLVFLNDSILEAIASKLNNLVLTGKKLREEEPRNAEALMELLNKSEHNK